MLDLPPPARPRSPLAPRPTLPPMLGSAPSFLRAKRALERFAPLQHAVLVRGETGTGKELAARLLHQRSGRSGPFVAINCGAIPHQLAESLLFGHVRGAFTGASRTAEGAFARAAGGTLFLDEIGELPRLLQPKLLRALESGLITPVGGAQESFIDVRVVSATHQDLEQMMTDATFREDLFHRLSILEVELPPLRRRRRDISILLDHFIEGLARDSGRRPVLSAPARQAADDHDWPGNVRALKNALIRASALIDGPIQAQQLIPKGRSPRVGMLRVPRGDYASMTRQLLLQIVAEEGSIRKAAQVLAVPRSTLGAWLKRGDTLATRLCLEPATA